MQTKPDRIGARLPGGKPKIVGVVGSRADWEFVSRAGFSDLDLCELRVDLLAAEGVEEREYVKPLPISKILTIRDPREGGREGLNEQERLHLFRRLLPAVDYIDIELRNFDPYSPVIAAVRSSAKQLIVSVHDFEGTPSEEQMERWAHEIEARYPGAIFKIAAQLTQWEEMVRLGTFLVNHSRMKVAAMGMGPLGKISRLLFARFGSELLYAACGEALVPGQWDLRTLRSILPEIVEGI
ncbi:MAG TPA: type I 3-dehydroquinate dehydratase [Chthoniobacterales bacterium]|nr:type I 3-dehydroquinate dehydratase [Chthoniobacterales bacterium]